MLIDVLCIEKWRFIDSQIGKKMSEEEKIVAKFRIYGIIGI
jgi:hypothetical protein